MKVRENLLRSGNLRYLSKGHSGDSIQTAGDGARRQERPYLPLRDKEGGATS